MDYPAADSVEGIHEWYQFRDFAHFIEVYLTICSCIKTADDMELVATEFVKGRAREIFGTVRSYLLRSPTG
jgi:hypothetical protein